ncbi:MAG TPA: hypothetical protein VFR64_10460 [Methylomirabilota bacterium]|nr:hypothetical protein [Methylomirabilota bacterium]
MATKKKSEPKQDEAKPNREQRRREKFGKHGPATHDPNAPWPESVPNPALGRGGDDQEAYAGRPDQDVTRNTGPGSGGATQGEGQRPQREGVRPGQSTKG